MILVRDQQQLLQFGQAGELRQARVADRRAFQIELLQAFAIWPSDRMPASVTSDMCSVSDFRFRRPSRWTSPLSPMLV